MDEIVSTVDNSYNAEDPSRPAAMGFIGSEDFLRAKFEVLGCSQHYFSSVTADSLPIYVGVHLFLARLYQAKRLPGRRRQSRDASLW